MALMAHSEKNSPAARACLACRSKHLRCDGEAPICARCTRTGVSCVWVRSRRGHRNGTKTPSAMHSDVPNQVWTLPAVPQATVSQDQLSVTEETISMPGIDSNHNNHDYLIDIYYQNVHPAHPFTLPRRIYLQDRAVLPDHLKYAMCFIASHHCSSAPEEFQRGAESVFQTVIPDDAFKVQTLLLLTLTFYARFERDLGNKAITTAIDVALKIGLNSDAFGFNQSRIWQESWRRTWWELYTITGLVSLISGMRPDLDYPALMTLPIHCEDYDTLDDFPPLLNTHQMQQRFSHEESFRWSSFSYRVEAMRILCSVISVVDEFAKSPCDAANASISSFLLSIPAEKREGLRRNGEIDEVMTCALMIVHLAAICLHLPRSNLADIRSYKTVCGTDRGNIGTEHNQTHRFAALRSAKAISNLISSRPSLKTMSPCFSCAIAFAAIVQLSECLSLGSIETNYLREYIQLELSTLNVLGETWPIARVVRGQVAQFTREVFYKASQDTSMQSLPLPMDEQWLRDFITEDTNVLPEANFALPGTPLSVNVAAFFGRFEQA